MTAATLEITDGLDDGFSAVDGTSFNLSGTWTPWDNTGYSFYRFTNVPVPQGSIVNSAGFRTTSSTGKEASQMISIYAEVTDNSLPVTDWNFSQNRVWQYLGYDVSAVIPANATIVVDVKPLIEFVVNRPGWVAGNAATLILIGRGVPPNSTIEVIPDQATVEHANALAPALILDWGVATPPPEPVYHPKPGDFLPFF